MSLTALIIFSLVVLVATLIVQGVGIYILFPIIATIMFAIRKMGVIVRFNNIIICEVMPFVLLTVFQLLFHRFDLMRFIVTIILRCIFIGIVVYDSKVYTYFTEEREEKK